MDQIRRSSKGLDIVTKPQQGILPTLSTSPSASAFSDTPPPDLGGRAHAHVPELDARHGHLIEQSPNLTSSTLQATHSHLMVIFSSLLSLPETK